MEQLLVWNGGIYIAKPEVLNQGRLWGDHCLGHVMPQERPWNINTPFDFAVAELLIKQRKQAAKMNALDMGCQTVVQAISMPLHLNNATR